VDQSTIKRTPCVVVVVDVLITFRKRLAVTAVTLPKRSDRTTGASKLNEEESKELAACVTCEL